MSWPDTRKLNKFFARRCWMLHPKACLTLIFISVIFFAREETMKVPPNGIAKPPNSNQIMPGGIFFSAKCLQEKEIFQALKKHIERPQNVPKAMSMKHI